VGIGTLAGLGEDPELELLMAFDLLYHDGRDLTGRPLRERCARLEDLVTGSEPVFPVRRLAPDGLEAWAQVVERGYEGYVAKGRAEPVRGWADETWLKVKQVGWTASEDRWKRVLLGPGTLPTQASRAQLLARPE
jgi:ATP-dependent DNA ligase